MGSGPLALEPQTGPPVVMLHGYVAPFLLLRQAERSGEQHGLDAAHSRGRDKLWKPCRHSPGAGTLHAPCMYHIQKF